MLGGVLENAVDNGIEIHGEITAEGAAGKEVGKGASIVKLLLKGIDVLGSELSVLTEIGEHIILIGCRIDTAVGAYFACGPGDVLARSTMAVNDNTGVVGKNARDVAGPTTEDGGCRVSVGK